MSLPEIQDRLGGVAVGAAVGDALGMPLEFQPPTPVEHMLRNFHAGRLNAGSFTDDTEMALALAESLLARAPLEGTDLVGRFVDWYRRGPSDIGFQTASMLRALGGGKNWEQASAESLRVNPESAGNGSVMRCWPVALKWWRDPTQLALDSALQSKITHPHVDCVDGSVFINRWIAEIIAGAPQRVAFETALEQVEMADSLRAVIRLAPLRRRAELENSGWVRHTLETAAWAVLTTDSFAEAVIQAANLGNDADTGAAVTGAVAGAVYGLGGIPQEWRSALHGEWPLGSGKVLRVKDFMELALKLGLDQA